MAFIFNKKHKEATSEGPAAFVEVEGTLGSGRVFALKPGDNLIGRWDPDAGAFPDIDLELDDAEYKISRKHAVIKMTSKGLSIRDLGSLNGTYINRGGRLEFHKDYELQDNDEIIVGKTFLRVYFEIQ